jgi:hypothetical protein
MKVDRLEENLEDSKDSNVADSKAEVKDKTEDMAADRMEVSTVELVAMKEVSWGVETMEAMEAMKVVLEAWEVLMAHHLVLKCNRLEVETL